MGRENSNSCGNKYSEAIENELFHLSEAIKQKYKVVKIIHKFHFQKTIKIDNVNADVNYDMFTCVLQSSEYASVLLHYLKMKSFQTKDALNNVKKYPTITNIYSPIGLTLSTQSNINAYGLYDSFIPSGMYICKFLEYKSQFGKEFMDNYNFFDISVEYMYIASIYQNLFPYTDPTFLALEAAAVK